MARGLCRVRFNFEWPVGYGGKPFVALLILLAVHALACRWAGLYRGMWIFASLPDLKRVLRAVGVSTVALMALLALDHGPGPIIPGR